VKWADRNLMQVDKRKKPKPCTWEGITPCTSTVWKADQLVCVRQNIASICRKVTCPLHLALVRHIWSAACRSGLPCTREIVSYWSKSNEEQQSTLKDWSICH